MLPFLQCLWWNSRTCRIWHHQFKVYFSNRQQLLRGFPPALGRQWLFRMMGGEVVYTPHAPNFFIFSDIWKGNKFYSDCLGKNVSRRRMQDAGAQFFGYHIICGNSAEPLNNLQIRVHAFATPAISVSKPASKTENRQKTSRRRRTVSWKSKSSGRWPTDM